MPALHEAYILSTLEEEAVLSEKENSRVSVVKDTVDGTRYVRRQFATTVGLPIYRSLLGMAHPNLPKVLHVFASSGGYTVLEEYIHGATIKSALTGAPLPAERVLGIAIQLCDALEALHSKAIIHRDVNPSNIMVTGDGTGKLIDFDAAKEYKPDATADTTTLGTKAFAAPEQFGYAKTDARTDIYCLGATMYHMLVGQVYVVGNKIPAGAVGRVVGRCLQVDPDKRYRSARDLKKNLIKLNTSAADNKIKAGIGVFGLLILAVIFFALLRDPEATPTPYPLAGVYAEQPPLAVPSEAADDGGGEAYADPLPPTQEETSDAPQEAAPPPTAADEPLFDINDVRLTVMGLTIDHHGDAALDVHIENNSNYTFRVGTQYESVNGFMFPSALLSETVTAGNRARASVRFPRHGLERIGIDTIGVIGLSFLIWPQDDWDSLMVTERFEINTSAYARFAQPMPEVLHTVYRKEGFQIAYMGLFEPEFGGGAEARFLIGNDTGQSLRMSTNNVAVNRYMTAASMSELILPGKMAVASLYIGDWRLEEIGVDGIAHIETLEFTFIIYDPDDWDNRTTSEPIVITIPTNP